VRLCIIRPFFAAVMQLRTYTVRFCTRSSGAREMVQKRTVLHSMPQLKSVSGASTRPAASSAQG
jgi:hypothetical protein